MTNQNAEIQKIADAIIQECHLDYDGLWCIISAIKYNDNLFENSDVRPTVFTIIRLVLQEKDIVVGNFMRKGDAVQFQPWDCSIEEAIIRIDSEWTKLGRDPSVNEIAWFAAKNILSMNH